MTRPFLAKAKVVLLIGMIGLSAVAAEVELHYFWSATCPDCQVMKAFLDELSQEYPELTIVAHEVTFNPDNWRLMVALAQAYGLTKEVTPTVIVGNLAAAGIGRAVELRIREEVERCLAQGCPSPLERLPGKLRPALSPLEIALLVVVGLGLILLVWGK